MMFEKLKQIRLDILISILGILAGLVLVSLTLLFQKGIGLAFTILISFLLYLILIKLPFIKPKNFFINIKNQNFCKFILIFMSLDISISLLIMYINRGMIERQEWHFIIFTILAILLLIIIFLNNYNNITINNLLLLATIIFITTYILCLLTSLGNLSYAGYGDHMFHKQFISDIISSGKIINGGIYNNYPVMHIFVAIGSIYTNISDYNWCVFLFILFPFILCLLFIYIILRKITTSLISMLSIFLTGFSLYYIFWATFLIPFCFSLIFITLSVFVFLYLYDKNKLIFYILFIILSLDIIYTHSFAAIAMMLVALSIIISITAFSVITKNVKYFYHNIYYIINLCLYIFVLVIYYFVSNLYSYLSIEASWALNSLTNIGILGLSSSMPLYVYELNNVPFYIFYALFIIFVLNTIYINISVRINNIKQWFVITFISIFILFSNFGYILGIQELLPSRWLLFPTIFMGYTASESIILIDNRVKYSKYVVIFILPILLILFMICNTTINPTSTDNAKYGLQDMSLTDSGTSAHQFVYNHINERYAKDFSSQIYKYNNQIIYKYYVYRLDNFYTTIDTFYDNGKINMLYTLQVVP